MNLADIRKRHGLDEKKTEQKNTTQTTASHMLDEIRARHNLGKVTSTREKVEEIKAKPKLYENEAEYYAANARPYDEVKAELDAVTKRRNTYDNEKAMRDSGISGKVWQKRYGEKNTERIEELARMIEMENKRIDSLTKEAQYGRLKGYNDLANNEDFDAKSVYDKNAKATVANQLYRQVNNPELPLTNEEYSDATREITRQMTADEVKIFNYIYNTQGDKAAQEYFDYLKTDAPDPLNSRRGKEIAGNIDTDVGRAIYGGIAAVDNTTTGIKQLFKEEAVKPTVAQYASAEAAEDVETKVGKFAYDLSATVGNMAPSILASAVLGKVAGEAVMGAATAGNTYTEAINSGMTPRQAMKYGVLVGASEIVTGSLLGGISALGLNPLGNAAGKLVSGSKFAKLLGATDNAFIKAAAKMAGSMAGEVAEEEAQLFLEPLFKKMATGEEYDAPEWEEIVYTALLSAASAGLFEAPGNIAEAVQESRQKKAEKIINDAIETVKTEQTAATQTETAQNEVLAENEAQTSNDTAEEKAAEVKRKDAYSEMVQNYADSMDAAGQNVFIEAYDGSVEPDVYVKEMQDAYDAGRRGEELTASETAIGDDRRQLAYKAGEADRVTEQADYGFVHNASSKTVDRNLVQDLNRVAKALKVKIQFADEIRGGTAEGVYRNGVITISRNAKGGTYMELAKHEITHHLEKTAPVAYSAYQRYALETLAGNYGISVEQMVQDRIAQAAASGDSLTAAEAKAEIAADFAKLILTDEKNLRRFVEANSKTAEGRNMLQRLFDAIRRFIAKVTSGKTKYTQNTELIKEMGLNDVSIAQLEKAERLYREVLKEGAEQRTGVSGDSGKAQASIVRTSKMDYSVQLHQIEGNKLNGSNSLYAGMPSTRLVRAGLPDEPFAMNQGDYRKARRESAKNENRSSHDVPYAFFKDMPRHLSETPLLIDNGKKITMITDYAMVDTKGQKSFVAAGVWLHNPMESYYVNQIKSAYPLDDMGRRIVAAAEEGKLVVVNKNKVEQMLTTIGIQPAEVSRVLNLAKTNITQLDTSVKSQKSAAGGDSLEMLRKKYGEIEPGEHPFREAHIPKRTEKKKYVSQTVRTAYEAKATPDYILPEIEQLIETGAFSFEKYSDEAAYNRAKTKIEGGYTDAYNEWFADVRGAKVSKDITALGWALYDYALTKENKVEDALKILTAMAANVRLGAQAVQAVGILKKLTPEGKLAVAQQMASKINDDIRKRESTPKQRRKIEQDAEELSEDITEARKTAARNISRKLKGGANKGAADYKQRAPFVFEYAQTVGEAVAATISKEKKEAERTTMDIITSQLTKFAREKMSKAKGANKTDILLDLVNNYEFYRDAYEFAKNEIQRVYGDDERFAEFLKSPVYGSSLVLKEVAQTALDIGETAKLIREKDALGMDIWDVANAVGDKLIEKTGATGSAASMLREAAYGYVFDILKTKSKNDTQMVDEIVRGTLRDIGVRISDFVAKSDDAKDNLKDVVTSLLVRKYNIPADRAAQAADIIGKQFEQMVKTEAEATLKRKFEEKKYQNPKEKKHRKTISEMITELAYLGAFDMGSPFNRTATMKVFESKDTIEIDPVLAERLVNAKTERAREEALQDIYRDIGRQTPSNWRDKWNAWRYLAMLGNPKTHVRNIAGNALFAPIVGAKNMAATGIEALVYKATGGKIERTKAMPTKELLKAAWDDFDTVSDKVLAGEKYNDRANANKYIEEGRQIYKNKMLEGARRKSSELLDKEDEWFLKPHYAFALAQYCKANNITPEMLKAEKGSDKIKADSARAYAAVEAQKATYRDANAVSDLFGRIGKYEGDNAAAKALSTAVDAVLPFRKTPANILVRAVEYSPAGLIKSLSIDFARVDKGAISPAQQIDNIAAGLTGTALMGLGFVLGKLGKVIGMNGDEEDERKFNELQGYQGYAWRGENRTYTLDWLAPEAMPFFVGVNLAETKALEEMDMAAAIESLMNITAPMLEMSCLQGLNDLIDSASSVTGKGVSALAKMAANAATSYLTQALPTLFGQVERVTESTRQQTYTDKGNKVLTPNVQYTLGKAFNKLPGDVGQIPYIDAWGRETETGNFGARAFNNLVNPGYSAKIRTSEMEKELQRLFDETGEKSVLPDRAAKYITVEGEKIDLNKNQYVKYAKVRGQTAYDMLTKITASSQYKALDEQSKVDLIGKVYSYANAIAKAEATKTQKDKALRYQPDGWIEKAVATSKATGIPAWKYVLIYNGQTDIRGLTDKDGDTISLSSSLLMMEYLYGFIGLSDAQRQALYADFGVAKSVRHYDRQRVAQELKKMRAK